MTKSYHISVGKEIKKWRKKVDDFVKSLKIPFSVIPAKAGIQSFQVVINSLDSGACPGPDPGFTGVTTFYETFKVGLGSFFYLDWAHQSIMDLMY